jgi:ubiquinone/menaquinone biosynthesis C-methylase UbiE
MTLKTLEALTLVAATVDSLGVEDGCPNMNDMDEHFSGVANKYNHVRTTDRQPIEYIQALLSKYEKCFAVDVGCGPGRYSLPLLQIVPQLHLTCLDRSSKMIAETERVLRAAKIDRFEAITSDASAFPLGANSVDVVFTFNAIHHFIMPAFFRESKRVLRSGGFIGIYTRLLSQNETSIWGKYFPDFALVERRLYSLDSIEAAIRSIPGLTLDTIKFFRFERVSSLERLIEQARARHYSTFSLYNEERLEECISDFRENVMRAFPDANQVRWSDGNVFLTAKAC